MAVISNLQQSLAFRTLRMGQIASCFECTKFPQYEAFEDFAHRSLLGNHVRQKDDKAMLGKKNMKKEG